MDKPQILRLNEADNVVIAIAELREGTPVEGSVRASRRIPRGHKIASRAIPSGQPIRKFGQIIGFASTDIAPGDWVHEQNVSMGGDFERDYAFSSEAGARKACAKARFRRISKGSAAPTAA
ncbi:UxaA family hydrolase [Paracoccus fontiphilus]|uniref:UxaA family hydrolase n=1 Tax=Paracoccus fontiphilus TaxID=1815556 RepID=A0ABV7IL96_9RHOB